MPVPGSASRLFIADNIGFTGQSELSRERLGLAALGFNETRPSRRVPGGSRHTNRESRDVSDVSGTFTTDANDVTAPLIAAAHAKKRWFRWLPEGAAIGDRRYRVPGYPQVTVNMSGGETITFAVTVDGDGAVSPDVLTSAIAKGAIYEGQSYKASGCDFFFYDGQAASDILALSGDDGDAGEGTLAFTTTYNARIPTGSKATVRFPQMTDAVFSLAQVYYGETARLLREASEMPVKANASEVAILTPFGAYVGGVMPEGIDVQETDDAAIIVGANLPFRGACHFGSVEELSLASGLSASTDLDAVPAGYDPDDGLWAVVKSSAVSTGQTATIGDGTNDSDPFPLRTGIFRVTGAPSTMDQLDVSAALGGAVDLAIVYGSPVGIE